MVGGLQASAEIPHPSPPAARVAAVKQAGVKDEDWWSIEEPFWNDGYKQWVSIRGSGTNQFSHVCGIPTYSSLSGHHWGKWLQKMDHIHTREHLQPQKRRKSPFKRAWMSLEDIVPGTDSKNTLCHSPWESYTVQLLITL